MQNERTEQILKLVRSLDISPTHQKNAEEKYNAITNFLAENKLNAVIYPFGSFSLGTVIRGSKRYGDQSYDLDVVCQVSDFSKDSSPAVLRDKISKILLESDRYKDKVKIENECITVIYADCNDFSFSIDIVPAVSESDAEKVVLKSKGNHPDLIDTAISIAKHKAENQYEWLANNPKGFQKWFEEINYPYLLLAKKEQEETRDRIANESSEFRVSIDPIPTKECKSSLQHVIQILKLHRDCYYTQINKEELKPISALLTAMTTSIVKKTANNNETFLELLKLVLKEIRTYSELLEDGFSDRHYSQDKTRILAKNNNKWEFPNPANSNDNLINKWNEDPEIPKLFFSWVVAIQKDLTVSITEVDNHEFTVILENAFGEKRVKSILGSSLSTVKCQPINPSTAPKPYRSL